MQDVFDFTKWHAPFSVATHPKPRFCKLAVTHTEKGSSEGSVAMSFDEDDTPDYSVTSKKSGGIPSLVNHVVSGSFTH